MELSPRPLQASWAGASAPTMAVTATSIRTTRLRFISSFLMMPNADGLQLRPAISIQAQGIRLLERHAIAPSAARLCWIAAVISIYRKHFRLSCYRNRLPLTSLRVKNMGCATAWASRRSLSDERFANDCPDLCTHASVSKPRVEALSNEYGVGE